MSSDERKVENYLRTAMEKVKAIFDRYPDLKRMPNDTLLILLYWRTYQPEIAKVVFSRVIKPPVLYWEDIPFEAVKALEPPETIRRCRQKLWEIDERYRPPKEIIEERRKKERSYRKVLKSRMTQLEL